MAHGFNENYCVGVNRFAIDSYFVFDKKDTLAEVLRNNRYAYPAPDTQVLFVSKFGSMDLAYIVDFDRVNNKAAIKYKGENFWFYTEPQNIIMIWQQMNKIPPELVSSYDKSEFYNLLEALNDLDKSLDNFYVNKHKFLDKVKSNNDLLTLEKSMNKIKEKFENIFNEGDFKV